MPVAALRASVILCLGCTVTASAQDAAAPAPPLSLLIESIVRSSLPETFEDDRHWNKHQEVFSGFKVRSRGLDVRISKREKSVRHGFWRKVTVTLLDPAQTFRLQINNVQPVGDGRYTFEVVADVRAQVVARFEHWNLDVKLLNGSTKADASLRLRADCSLQWELTSDNELGPVVILKPDVVNVDLELQDLDLRRLGQLAARSPTNWGTA